MEAEEAIFINFSRLSDSFDKSNLRLLADISSITIPEILFSIYCPILDILLTTGTHPYDAASASTFGNPSEA